MKYTVAFQVEYDVDPEIYTDPDPEKMAKEDIASAKEAPPIAVEALAYLPGAKFVFKVEPQLTASEEAGLEVIEV